MADELMNDPMLINLVARVVQDHFGTPLGDPARPHLLLSKREEVAREILDGLSMLGCIRIPTVPLFLTDDPAPCPEAKQ